MTTLIGAKYQDKITGFEGIAIGLVTYISGCKQVLLAPKVGNDGKRMDAEWFDEQRVEIVGTDVITLDNGSTPGCDLAAPKR